ncbi:MAG: hypothetical protein ACKVXR_04245 [Planctomycetota bacterium]
MSGPCAAILLALAAVASGQEDPARRSSPQGEGALGNDVFLPTSDRAAQALEQAGADFEAWRNALAESGATDCVPAPRGTESVDRAVFRRVRSGGAELIAAWRERFEAPAERARRETRGDPRLLARVARDWPLTRAAARAALGLADRALEEGNARSAASWLERAAAHADRGDRDLLAAIERRASATGGGPSGQPSAWTQLALESSVALAPPGEPREGIRPGLVLLEDGRACVQGSDALHLVGEDGQARSFPLRSFVREFGWSWIEPFVEERGTWILQPASDGRRVAVVAGRAARTRGNALLLLDVSAGKREPKLAWGYSDGGFLGEISGSRTLAETLGPGLWEFEPGPLFAGDTVVAQLRQWTSENDEAASVDESSVKAWCFAFEADTGLPKWKTLLAIGPSAKVELWGARGFARPADPLAELPGRLFASTGIGAGVFLDPLLGSPIRSLRNRRAPDGATRGSGAAFPVALDSRGSTSAMIWAPSDSDRIYTLQANPVEGLESDLLRAPEGIDGRFEAIGAHGARVLLLSEAGDRGVLSSLDLDSGVRVSAAELPRGERLCGGLLVPGSRAIVASDRAVRMFDLSRDLYLLDAVSLEGAGAGLAVGIAAVSDRVLVASERQLWILRAR